MILKYLFYAAITTATFASHHLLRKQRPPPLPSPPIFTATELQERIIAMNLDQSVSPCDDFYAYACGSYAEHNSNRNYQEITSYMDYQYNIKLLNLIDSLYRQDHRVANGFQTFIDKAIIYLKSCRSQNKREIKKYFEEFKPAKEVNWPIWEPQQWQQDNVTNLYNMWSLLGRMHSYGLNNVLVNQEILVQANGSVNIMLEPFNLEDNTTLPDVMVMRVFLKNLDAKMPKRILNNLQKLNQKLIQIVTQLGDNNNGEGDILLAEGEDEEESIDYIELPYQDLDKQFPNLQLKQFLFELLASELTDDTLITIRDPTYFHYLNENMWTLFSQQDMCNYLMLKFLFHLALDSTPEFTALACVKDVRNKMDVAVNYLYYNYLLSNQIMDIIWDIGSIKNDIIREFFDLFQENNLNLTPQHIHHLQEKLMAVNLKIGNLPFNVTNESMEKYYENLPALDRNNYFKNHLLLLKHRFQKSLNYPGHQTHYIVTDNKLGSSSGAFYVPQQNMIVLSFAALQMPFYDLDYNPLQKYSLLAFILAHEYTHAFDTTGLYFDDHGNLATVLPTVLDETNFQNSLKCLQSQLSTDSIDERLADIVGSRVVFNIFDKLYDSMRISWQKPFILNMAQFFCGKANIEFVGHDADAERLNQIVINLPSFAYAFNCPENSRMTPRNRCRVY